VQRLAELNATRAKAQGTVVALPVWLRRQCVGFVVSIVPAGECHQHAAGTKSRAVFPDLPTLIISSVFWLGRIHENRRLEFASCSIAEIPIFRMLTVCGEVAEWLKAAVC
jgi:hypothetical protein